MKRRTEIQTAAIRLIDELGAARVSVRLVGEAAFISPSAIYRHFSTLAELLLACRRQLIDDVTSELRRSADPVRSFGEWVVEHPRLARFAWNPEADSRSFDPELIAFGETLLPKGSELHLVYHGIAHLLSAIEDSEYDPTEEIGELLELHRQTTVADPDLTSTWLDRHVHHELLEVVVERVIGGPPDDLCRTTLQLAAARGRFPTRREVAAVLDRSVSALYPMTGREPPEQQVRRLLAAELAPALLAGQGTGLERFWDFLLKAGVLGFQYPGLISLVATKPTTGRSPLESLIIDTLGDGSTRFGALATASYVLGNVLCFVRNPRADFTHHIHWMAASFSSAAN